MSDGEAMAVIAVMLCAMWTFTSTIAQWLEIGRLRRRLDGLAKAISGEEGK